MNRTEKAELGAMLKEKFLKARVAIFADYKGLEATQADDLRRQLREQNTEVKVLKNNITRVICKDGSMGEGLKSLSDELVGPTMVAFSYGDVAAAAKIMHKFATTNEALKLKDSVLGKNRISAKDIEALAKLPAREVLLAKVLATFNAPATNFVGVLAAVPRSLLNVLTALEKKKTES